MTKSVAISYDEEGNITEVEIEFFTPEELNNNHGNS